MIFRSEDLKSVCQKILNAVDSNSLSQITDIIYLHVNDCRLNISVTNGEYYTNVSIPVSDETSFEASVNASMFLKLISQITTDTIELYVKDTNLVVSGNGKYKIPIVYKDEDMLKISEINIDNITSEFEISSENLLSMMNFNSKEIAKTVASDVRPVQRLYYLDSNGCITFTTGACVNNFTVDSSIKILLTDKIVKLFKLFKAEQVKCVLGNDMLGNGTIQTKIRFETDNVKIVSVLNSDMSLINSVPVDIIRRRASDNYPHVVSLNKNELVQALNRLLIFADSKNSRSSIGYCNFSESFVEIYDKSKVNKETIYYQTDTPVEPYEYSLYVDINDIKATVENCKDEYITVGFGNSQAIVVKKNNITNIIPECSIS